MASVRAWVYVLVHLFTGNNLRRTLWIVFNFDRWVGFGIPQEPTCVEFRIKRFKVQVTGAKLMEIKDFFKISWEILYRFSSDFVLELVLAQHRVSLDQRHSEQPLMSVSGLTWGSHCGDPLCKRVYGGCTELVMSLMLHVTCTNWWLAELFCSAFC